MLLDFYKDEKGIKEHHWLEEFVLNQDYPIDCLSI